MLHCWNTLCAIGPCRDQLEPRNQWTHNNLSLLYAYEEKYEKAIVLKQDAADHDANHGVEDDAEGGGREKEEPG